MEHVFEALLALTVILAAEVSTAPTEKTSFTLFTRKSTWNEAYCICWYYGMDMLALDTEEKATTFKYVYENTVISSASSSNDHWFGLYNSGISGNNYTYNWTDGQPYSWKNWDDPVEPNYEYKDKCVRIYMYIWKTMICYNKYTFFCQKPLGSCTMEKVNPSTSLGTASESFDLAESECIRYCEDDSSAIDQCYAVQLEAPSTCHVYKSSDNNMFVKRSDESLLDSTSRNIYRKVCYEGSVNTGDVTYSDNGMQPSLTCGLTTTSTTSSSTTTSTLSSTSPSTTTTASTTTSVSTTTDASTTTSPSTTTTPSTTTSPPTTTTPSTTTSTSTTTTPSTTTSTSATTTPSTTSTSTTTTVSTLTSPATTSTIPSTEFSFITEFLSAITNTPISPPSNASSSSSTLLALLAGSSSTPLSPSASSLVSASETSYQSSSTLGIVLAPSSSNPNIEPTSVLDISSSGVEQISSLLLSPTTQLSPISLSTSLDTTVSQFTRINPKVSLCGCKCSLNSVDFQLELQQVVDKLTVIKNTTSSYRRKLTSAEDVRPSAQALGAVGIFMFTITIGVVVVLDAARLIRFMYRQMGDKGMDHYQ